MANLRPKALLPPYASLRRFGMKFGDATTDLPTALARGSEMRKQSHAFTKMAASTQEHIEMLSK